MDTLPFPRFRPELPLWWLTTDFWPSDGQVAALESVMELVEDEPLEPYFSPRKKTKRPL